MIANALIQSATILHKNEIKLADENPDQWYELFVYSEESGSQSIESGDTFEEVCKHLRQCINEHVLESIGIDIWSNQINPCPMCTTLIPNKPVILYDQADGHHFELVFWDIKPYEKPDEVPNSARKHISEQLATGKLSGTFDAHQQSKVLEGVISYSGTWRVYNQ